MTGDSTSEYVNLELTLQGVLFGNEYRVIQGRLKNKTLEEIGQDLGVTRQRIKQIETKALRMIRASRESFASSFQDITNCLSDEGDVIPAKEATTTLRDRGIISGLVFNDFHSISLFSQWLGIGLVYRVHDIHGEFVVTDSGYDQLISQQNESLRSIFMLNKIMQRTCGILSARHVAVSEIATEEEIKLLLEGDIQGISLFSAEGSNWLMRRQRKCHISTQAKKVFSVCDRIGIELLSSQLERSLKARAYEGWNDISTSVIAEWVKTSGFFEITDDLASCAMSEQLSDAEKIITSKLDERDKWYYADLADNLVGEITIESLSRFLQFSPLVVCDKSGGRKSYTYASLSRCLDLPFESIDLKTGHQADDPDSSKSETSGNPDESKLAIGDMDAKKSDVDSCQFSRNPKITDWILVSSAGICECCQKDAPFKKADGVLYLEVHHVKMLSEGGSDTIHNAIAVCPNCHRELHHGENRNFLQSEIYARISRLVPE
jgi:hypothetical protein